MIGAKSRAHRILKPLANYSYFIEGDEREVPSLVVSVLSESEQPLGIYRNEPNSLTDAIIFTTKGMYLHEAAHWRQILYSEIERTEFPKSKIDVTGLTILCRGVGELWLPVRGSKLGRFFDAFEMLRFLDRVTADIRGQLG